MTEQNPASETRPYQPDAACWLCDGLGGVALHEKWSGERGKPLWTAHEHPSADAHPTKPCPACASQNPASETRPSPRSAPESRSCPDDRVHRSHYWRGWWCFGNGRPAQNPASC